MVFASRLFLIFVAVALLLFWLAPKRYKVSFVLPLINASFMGIFIDAPDLLYLGAFLVYGFVLTHVASQYKGHKILWAGAGSIVFLFVYLRQYNFFSFMPYPENLPFIVGLSYVFFRVMQLVIDACNGDISKPPAPVRYFNFTCNFLMLLSGPIQRYQEYVAQENNIEEKKIDESEALSAFTRILVGFVKAGPLSALVFAVHDDFLSKMDTSLFNSLSEGSLILGATASFYTLFLYLNFSGYTDIVIGLGRLFGFTLPENFNKPMNAENFIDLWQRWHMSLANWMRLYVFNPTVKFLAYRVHSPAMLPYLSVIAFFTTFMLLGSWHGPDLPFLLCGLLLGTAMALNKIYQIELKKRLGKEKTRTLQSSWLYRQLCFGLTFMWLAFSIVGFWADWNKIVVTSIDGGVAGILFSFAATVILSAIARIVFKLAMTPVAFVAEKIEKYKYKTPLLYIGFSLMSISLYFYHQFWIIEPIAFVYEGF